MNASRKRVKRLLDVRETELLVHRGREIRCRVFSNENFARNQHIEKFREFLIGSCRFSFLTDKTDVHVSYQLQKIPHQVGVVHYGVIDVVPPHKMRNAERPLHVAHGESNSGPQSREIGKLRNRELLKLIDPRPEASTQIWHTGADNPGNCFSAVQRFHPRHGVVREPDLAPEKRREYPNAEIRPNRIRAIITDERAAVDGTEFVEQHEFRTRVRLVQPYPFPTWHFVQHECYRQPVRSAEQAGVFLAFDCF
ncbi:MAG: hypothetical protein BWY06_03322 [Candidatus Latescibacteria bacterium ADurb.Bin168]|nr:MAG: hypothetical protein BWY06_03322 [Candidatus Latescibacteria bacterium ADurb.Bin168]